MYAPMVQLRSGRSESSSWTLAEGLPHPALRGSIERYQGYEELSPKLRRIEPAQDRVTLIIGFDPLTVGAPRQDAAPRRVFVAPITDTWASCEFAGSSRGVQVDMTPAAGRALIGMPWSELEGRVAVELGELIGRPAVLLAERLEAAADWPQRFALVDRFLLSRMERAGGPRPDVAYAFQRIRASGGRLGIGELSAELGCSRRHLARHFRAEIGPGPKSVARIVRFRRAVELLRGDRPHLAEIAAYCGYHDQPHMNREFDALSGLSPGAYVHSARSAELGLAA